MTCCSLLQLVGRCLAKKQDQPLLHCVYLALRASQLKVPLVASSLCHVPLAPSSLHSLDIVGMSLQAASQLRLSWAASQQKLSTQSLLLQICVPLQAVS